MSGKDITYNGFTNYETWAVNLWLQNDQGTEEYWRAEASRHLAEAEECDDVEDGTWTAHQVTRRTLAVQLKDELEEGSPIPNNSLYSELLTAALREVDWEEVADAFLEE